MLAPLVLASALAFSPPVDEADDQYQLIVGLAKKELYDLVVQEAAGFLERFPGHARADSARFRLASALFRLERSEDARPHFQELSSRRGFEHADEVFLYLAICEQNRAAFDRSVPILERLLANSNEYEHQAAYYLGEAHIRSQRYELAETAFERSMNAAPAGEFASFACEGLVWSAYHQRAFERALERVDACIGGSSNKSELQFVRGESLLELDRPSEALEAYRRVGPGNYRAGAAHGMGFAYAAMGEHARAAERFSAVVDEFPDSAAASEANTLLAE